MKLTIIFTALTCLQVSASGFSQTITLQGKNMSLPKVFTAVETQTGFVFFYNAALLKNAKPVSIIAKQMPIESFLTEIFKEQQLDFAIREKTIVITKKASDVVQVAAPVKVTDVDVQGKVVTDNGPLSGATVKVQGTSVSVMTDDNGSFTLRNVNENATLEISYVGYQTQTIALNGRTSLNITLAVADSKMNEIVVVGYGTQKKANLTGSVSTVTFGKETEGRPITSASQAIAGKASGVWVSQNSGAPGDDAATLRIRGFGTLNDVNPLIIIDGVEGPLNQVNPRDIESITVLKDAASAAIYGARAANGVVLVTTKRGQYNVDPVLSYSGYYGIQNLGRTFKIIDNSAEFMKLWNTAVINSGASALFPDDVISSFENGNDKFKYPNTNFFEEIFESAPITQHTVSVRGGSAKENYYLSADYLKQEGILKNTSADRYGFTLNLNSKVKKWIELGGLIQGTRRTSYGAYNGIADVMYLFANGAYPFTAPTARSGKFGATEAVYLSGPNAGMPIVDTRNPLIDLYNGLTKNTNNFLKGNINATITIMPGLTFKSLYTGQFTNTRIDRFNSKNYAYQDNGTEITPFFFSDVITNSRQTSESYYSVFYNTLNYKTKFAADHNVSVIAGMQAEDFTLHTALTQRSNPSKDDLHEVDAGTSDVVATGTQTDWALVSYFGRLNYDYKEKYLFEANFRIDGSSRFADGNRWGTFPSFSAGWRISEEDFFSSSVIDQLKLRASWGRLGNQNIGNYAYLQTLAQNYTTSYNLGGSLVPGAAIMALVDSTISWETTEMTDIGVDIGLLQNRLNIELDYFNKNTSDILVQLPIPRTMGGVTAPVQNIGKVSNKGFEISVNYQSAPAKDFRYVIGANLTYVTNEVTKFVPNSPDQLYLIREGYSYNSLYGFKAIGVFQSDDEAEKYMPNNGYVPQAGDLKYEDVNTDGRLDYQDKQHLGNTIPKYTYGINIGLNYKNWSLNIVTQGIAKVNAYTQSAWTQPLGVSGGLITERWRDAWTPDNQSTTLPRIVINDTWNRYESSFWISNISYLRVKNIQLAYSPSKAFFERFNLKGASFYLNVQNLPAFVTSGYEGFDPERNTFNAGESLYPTPIISTVGVNLQF